MGPGACSSIAGGPEALPDRWRAGGETQRRRLPAATGALQLEQLEAAIAAAHDQRLRQRAEYLTGLPTI
jgi:hypothetical protein